MSRGRDLIGKVIVSEETGRKFGVVGDLNFVSESGELLNLVLVEPTKHIGDLALEKDEQNRLLVPFSSVKSVGDFVIISEKEIV
jgi:sporulation protein YlmC with PRC-barrel domain